MRVTAQASHAFWRGDLLPVLQQVCLAQASLQKGTRIHTRGTVWLKENQVTAMGLAARMEKMVEPNFKQICRAGITCNVASQLAISRIGTCHHGQRVPTNQRAQPLFHRQVTGVCRFTLDSNAIDIGRCQLRLPLQLACIGQLHQLIQNKSGTFRAIGSDQGQKRIEPFCCFKRVAVAGCGGGNHAG